MADPETVAKRPASAARIAANRRNSALSTGPRTPEGVARSSRNNTIHGMYSNDDVLPGECPGGI